MTTLVIEGKKVKVSDDFLSLSPEDQERTVEEIAAQMNLKPAKGESFMGQLNAGIADAVGGAVDFLNPFDNAVWQGTPVGMGSTRDALAGGMRAIGADVAEGQPTDAMGGVARGTGAAAGALLPGAGAVRLLRGAGGVIGGVADDAYNALASVPGAVTELLAGGIAGGASQSVRQEGGPEWLQQTAAILSPMAIPAVVGATRGAVNVLANTPLAGAAIRTGREFVRGVAPMTESGAREVVKARLRELAGSEERANELASMIDPNDPLGRTGPQQTGDQNMLGLQRAAGEEDPLARVRLAERSAATMDEAKRQVQGMGGKVADARAFFASRLREFKTSMQANVARVAQMGLEAVEGTAPRASESANSVEAAGRIRQALDAELAREAELWRAVPKEATVPTRISAETARGLLDELPRAQRNDFPGVAEGLLLSPSGLGPETTVNELHGLYSELRGIARAAMAGPRQNKNAARIANDIAEAILRDLGAIDASTPAGQAINEARAFSSALHETFDRGAVGRILQRTIDGDTQMAPEVALKRTVGTGGAGAMADDASIRRAAPDARENVADYLRGKFLDSVMGPDGSFTPQSAARWMRENRELLHRYPELKGEFFRAMKSQDGAAQYAARAELRIKAAESGSAAARFGNGQDSQAVVSILGAADPQKAARAAIATARKDPSGKAVAGVKGAFTDYLIGKAGTDAGLSGKKLDALLSDPEMSRALSQVFDSQEISRMRAISQALIRMDAPAADVGQVMDTPANKLLEYVVRIAAARQGGQMGGGTMGGSLQTANIFQERARAMLRNLTNDRARRMLMDAIEDPALFRALLTEPKAFTTLPERVRGKIAPYLMGGAAEAARDRTE